MTKKQLAALQRILDREEAAYQVLSGRPSPGQHPSQDKYAVSDGEICILSDVPFPDLKMGGRVDSLARIVQGERTSEAHFPVPETQIDLSRWARQINRCNSRPHGVEISAPIIHPDQLQIYQAEAVASSKEITGKFDPQLLVDAVDAVGGNPLFFLGYGPFNSHFPSLLVFPPEWTEERGVDPIALVFPLRW